MTTTAGRARHTDNPTKGRWGLVDNDCVPGRADAKGLMIVAADGLGFYESRGAIRRAEAIRENTLMVHYQPIVQLTTGRVVGAEALARWKHPRDGDISPARFVPIAELTGNLAGSGASSMQNAQTAWTESFMGLVGAEGGDLQVTYDSTGSGTGRTGDSAGRTGDGPDPGARRDLPALTGHAGPHRPGAARHR